MSNQLAMMNLWIACHSLVSHNITNDGTMISVPPEISNTSGLLNLYMACDYLAPRMLREMHTRDGEELSTNNINAISNIDPQTDLKKLTNTLELPEGYIKFADVGAAYKVYNETKSWNEARKYCLNENARLAVTNSVEKIRHVQSFLGSIKIAIWVGLHRLFDNSEWVELGTGKATISLFQNSTSAQNQCSSINSKYITDLSADNCQYLARFACEIPI